MPLLKSKCMYITHFHKIPALLTQEGPPGRDPVQMPGSWILWKCSTGWKLLKVSMIIRRNVTYIGIILCKHEEHPLCLSVPELCVLSGIRQANLFSPLKAISMLGWLPKNFAVSGIILEPYSTHFWIVSHDSYSMDTQLDRPGQVLRNI